MRNYMKNHLKYFLAFVLASAHGGFLALVAEDIIKVEIETEIQTQANVPVLHPVVAVASLLGECPGAIAENVGFKATAQWGDDVRKPGVDLKFSMASTLKEAVSLGINGKQRDFKPVATVCETVHHGNSMLHVSGGINLYVVSLGNIVPRQRAWANVEWEDDLIIESDREMFLEIPVHLQVNGFAAESLGGEKGDTFATVKADFSASADGQLMGQGMLDIESLTVIPEQDSIDLGATIPIHAKPGTNRISVHVRGGFEVEVQAKAVGLFNMIASSATGGLLLPGSFDIGHVQMANGSPLPKGVRVSSGKIGIDYQNTVDDWTPPLDLRIRMKQNIPWLEWSSVEGRRYQLQTWVGSEWIAFAPEWQGTGGIISVQADLFGNENSSLFRVQSWTDDLADD